MQSWQKEALKALDGIKLTPDYPMSRLTTFKIGGPIDLLAETATSDELLHVLRFCQAKALSWMVIGRGSNLLVRDKGIRGVGIVLTGEFTQWGCDEDRVWSGAGRPLVELAKDTACQGLAGLEFACGIPGTIGGAVFMNAGAYDGEMAQVLTRVEAIGADRGRVEFPIDELQLGYRQSIFQKEISLVITKAYLQLKREDPAVTNDKVTTLTCARESKQPLEMPSAGSVFRRPPGHYVGPLIEAAGLKGFAIGGAQVSPKHAGFIVNKGGATAKDVLDLIQHIRQVIQERNQVDLIPEIRVVGEE